MYRHASFRKDSTCMCVCMCVYVCVYAPRYVCTYLRIYVCRYVRMYVRTYVCIFRGAIAALWCMYAHYSHHKMHRYRLPSSTLFSIPLRLTAEHADRRLWCEVRAPTAAADILVCRVPSRPLKIFFEGCHRGPWMKINKHVISEYTKNKRIISEYEEVTHICAYTF
jgi:hypothetical protein